MQLTPSSSFGGEPVCNLRFADDIDLIGGSIGDLKDPTDWLPVHRLS